MEERIKPWPAFSVSVKLWVHSDMYSLDPFSCPEYIESLSQGPDGTSAKKQGSPEMISDDGAQRDR